jgi:hypothetical protein
MALDTAYAFTTAGSASVSWLKGNDGVVKSFVVGSRNRRSNALEVYRKGSSTPSATTAVEGGIRAVNSVFVGPVCKPSIV